MEAPSGFEPLHRSFADCSLTTWVRRLAKVRIIVWARGKRLGARGKTYRLFERTGISLPSVDD